MKKFIRASCREAELDDRRKLSSVPAGLSLEVWKSDEDKGSASFLKLLASEDVMHVPSINSSPPLFSLNKSLPVLCLDSSVETSSDASDAPIYLEIRSSIKLL